MSMTKLKVDRSECPNCCGRTFHECMGATVEFCEEGHVEVCTCKQGKCRAAQKRDLQRIKDGETI